MPSSLDSLATTGAAPVPVPPPMPAVMNTWRMQPVSCGAVDEGQIRWGGK